MTQGNRIPETPQRSPLLRLLAPAALIATTIVVIIVISSSLAGDSDSQGGGGGGGGQRGGGGQGQRAQTTNADRPPKRYEIESGDSLSAISDRFGVPVEKILELNPDIDPQALVTGEKLKLR